MGEKKPFSKEFRHDSEKHWLFSDLFEEHVLSKLILFKDNSRRHEKEKVNETCVTMWYIRKSFKDEPKDYKFGDWEKKM